MLLLLRQRCYCSGSPPCSPVVQPVHNHDDHDDHDVNHDDDDDDLILTMMIMMRHAVVQLDHHIDYDDK